MIFPDGLEDHRTVAPNAPASKHNSQVELQALSNGFKRRQNATSKNFYLTSGGILKTIKEMRSRPMQSYLRTPPDYLKTPHGVLPFLLDPSRSIGGKRPNLVTKLAILANSVKLIRLLTGGKYQLKGNICAFNNFDDKKNFGRSPGILKGTTKTKGIVVRT